MILNGGKRLPSEKDTPCEYDSHEYVREECRHLTNVHMPQNHQRLGLSHSGEMLNTPLKTTMISAP
jgi:hypothetical protein